MSRKVPRLKWHMLRRRRSDPPFLRANLDAGLAAGAALEVDVMATRDGAFVCLHDLMLDRQTTGSGPVAAATRADLLGVRQRGSDGAPLFEPPLFLDEVVAAVARLGRKPSGLLQIDIKDSPERFGLAAVERMYDLIAPMAFRFVVGVSDPAILVRFRQKAPEITVGFDPLNLYHDGAPATTGHYRALGAETMAVAPDAAVYYLEARVVLGGLALGVNLVEQVKANGAEVDVWTIDADQPNLVRDLRRLVAAGVDQITSNDPDALAPILEEAF